MSGTELSHLLTRKLSPGHDAFLAWFQEIVSLDAGAGRRAAIALVELAVEDYGYGDEVGSLTREAITALESDDPQHCERVREHAAAVIPGEADRADRLAERMTDVFDRHGDRVESSFRKESDGNAWGEAHERRRFAEMAKSLVEMRQASTSEKRAEAALTVAQRVLFSTLLSTDLHRAVVTALRASRPE